MSRVARSSRSRSCLGSRVGGFHTSCAMVAHPAPAAKMTVARIMVVFMCSPLSSGAVRQRRVVDQKRMIGLQLLQQLDARGRMSRFRGPGIAGAALGNAELIESEPAFDRRRLHLREPARERAQRFERLRLT